MAIPRFPRASASTPPRRSSSTTTTSARKSPPRKSTSDVIRDVDLNKLEPWEIQEKCKIGSTPQNDWYFFSHKDKKYPTGTRDEPRHGCRISGRPPGGTRSSTANLRRIGMRKTLVFYRGKSPPRPEIRLDHARVSARRHLNLSTPPMCQAWPVTWGRRKGGWKPIPLCTSPVTPPAGFLHLPELQSPTEDNNFKPPSNEMGMASSDLSDWGHAGPASGVRSSTGSPAEAMNSPSRSIRTTRCST
ncbi:hypothetical protein SASPL_130727 [Salvia splendens]|uniref:NAC domain-containing protein n=1 Tax=Salvia splendens TaxID=180675 RepID=A0A8X8X4R4_SALSN|nr:hypothetical protein SASPL_130727 [Salvia splendens]